MLLLKPHAAPQAYAEPENESAKPEHPHDEPPGQAKKA